MAHLLFPVLLYLLGYLLFIPAGDAIPRRFVAWTAFAWGALAWMVATLLALILPVPYTPLSVAVALGLIFLIVFLAVRRTGRRTIMLEPKALLLPIGLLLVATAIPTLLQMVEVHPDTYDMLLMATDLAGGELSRTTFNRLGMFGLGLPLIQSAAPWFGVAFFYSVPAAFAFTIIAALPYFCFEGLVRLGRPPRVAGRMANLVTLLFASTMWVFFQFAYIHNGSIAATYLLLAAGCGWLAMLEQKRRWLWLSSLAFLGLALARVETVFFTLAFFVVLISLQRFAISAWLRPLALFSALLLGWYSWLLLVARPDTNFLNTPRILAFAGAVVLFFAAVAALQLAALRRLLMPYLYRLLLLGLAAVTVLLILVYPLEQFVEPVWATIVTFFLLGVTWWGLIWWFILASVLLLAPAPAFPYQRALSGIIVAFFALYVIFGILHGYADAFDGSGNRMALHILPVIFLYLTLRAAPVVAPVRAGDYVDLTKTVRAPIADGEGLL